MEIESILLGAMFIMLLLTIGLAHYSLYHLMHLVKESSHRIEDRVFAIEKLINKLIEDDKNLQQNR